MTDDPSSEPVARSDQSVEIVVPLAREDLTVTRHKVETAVVSVATVTRTHDAVVDEALTHERVEIERLPIGQFIDKAPPVREEGNTTIISIVEEVLVVEKRLVLKEEVHLRRVRITERHQETVALREQEAVITRREKSADSNG